MNEQEAVNSDNKREVEETHDDPETAQVDIKTLGERHKLGTNKCHMKPVYKTFADEELSKNYEGWIMGAALMIVFNNIKVIIDHLCLAASLTYSLTIFPTPLEIFHLVMDLGMFCIFLLGSLFLEIGFHKGCLKRQLYEYVCVGYIVVCQLIYNMLLNMYRDGEGKLMIVTIQAILSLILLLKMISYHLTNRSMWIQANENDRHLYYGSSFYPNNLNIKNQLYFIVIPGLCYQPIYPTTNSKPNLKRIASYLCQLFIFYLMFETILSSYIKDIDSNYIGIGLNITKQFNNFIVNTLLWISAYQVLFVFLPLLITELTGFGDRQVIGVWWDSCGLEDYWREWNLSLYKWTRRHVFTPMTVSNSNRLLTSVLTFSIVSLLHGYVISTIIKKITIYPTLLLMGQLAIILCVSPFIIKIKSQYIKNLIFWIFFSVFSHPCCVWIVLHNLQK